MSDKPKHKQGARYQNDEERRKGYDEAQKRQGKKQWTCEICNKTMTQKNKTNHLRTTAHQRKACPTCSESED